MVREQPDTTQNALLGHAAVAARMAASASAFLAPLDAAQLRLAHWPFPSDDERHRWYYTPTDHGGLPLGLMRPETQRLALKLVASGLSRPGFATVSTIIGIENLLDELEGWIRDFDRDRGRDPGLYYLRIFGDPASAAWSWRFGGHHVSIHHLILDGEVRASTPCFLGADPAASPLLGGDLLRPLGSVEDLARALVGSFDEDQRARAVISDVAPIDLAGANRPRLTGDDLPLRIPDVWRGGHSDTTTVMLTTMQESAEKLAGIRAEQLDAVRLTGTPKGIPASQFTEAQRAALRTLLDVYLGRIPTELAAAEAEKYAGERLGPLHFAWAGSTAVGAPHYYRVQGPGLLLEYDNTQRGGNHVHSVWRDPDGDFGDDVLRRHYALEHVEPTTETVS